MCPSVHVHVCKHVWLRVTEPHGSEGRPGCVGVREWSGGDSSPFAALALASKLEGKQSKSIM